MGKRIEKGLEEKGLTINNCFQKTCAFFPTSFPAHPSIVDLGPTQSI